MPLVATSLGQNYQTAVDRLKEYNNYTLITDGSTFNSITIEGKEISKYNRNE